MTTTMEPDAPQGKTIKLLMSTAFGFAHACVRGLSLEGRT
jgi:hypothetical protein